MTRPLHAIAVEIVADPGYASSKWCAHPYVGAMLAMTTMDETYGTESARDIVRYALNNLKGWRGDTARRIKAELRGML